MIETTTGVCYSPELPDKYGYEGFGHGPYCNGDMQLWNLVFLSIPRVDGYLEEGADIMEVWHSVPKKHMGACVNTLRSEYVSNRYPIRHLLQMHPDLFLLALFHTPYWERLPVANTIPHWMGIVEERVLQIGVLGGRVVAEEMSLYGKLGVVINHEG